MIHAMRPAPPVGLPASDRPFFLQSIAAAGLELCWIYSVTALFFLINDFPPFPAAGALLLFLSAVVPGAIARGRGWRVYVVGLLYAVAFALSLLYSFYAFGRWNGGLPPTDLRWIGRAIGAVATGDAVTVVSLLAFSLAFFWSGIAFFRRSRSGDALTRRFDLGASAFGAVVFIEWVVNRIVPGIHLLMLSFFLFSVQAIAMARSHGTGRRSYAAGFRVASLTFTLGPAVLILGLALLPLLPFFQKAARAGYTALHAAVGSVWPFVLAILRFLFGMWAPSHVRADSIPGQRDALPMIRHVAARHPSLLEVVLMWVIFGLAGAAALFLVGYLIRQLVRFLSSRTPAQPVSITWFPLRRILRWLVRGLRRLRSGLRRLLRYRFVRHSTAAEAFAFLSRWGDRSGSRRRPAETPLHYARRLVLQFPELADPIKTIVEDFDESFYGGRGAGETGSQELERSCRALGNPRLWFRRVAGRFGGSGV